MKKFAISLPDHQADAIERIRRSRGVPRSRVIQVALEYYLASAQVASEAIRAYEAGYERIPEDPAEAEAYALAAAEVLGSEEWE